MRDVLGTIQADQDAIIRAGSRGALVVDGGPGTGKTVVALHRTAYLLYSDPRLGHRRGGVLFVGPHQPYLAYVADVLPSLGEEGVQTCTLRDLVPEGAAAAVETDPEVARLKASADDGAAIEPAVRFYEEPPTEGMEVETPWADVWLSADGLGRGVRGARNPARRTTRRATRSGRRCSTILVDKRDGRRTSRPTSSAGRCAQNEELVDRLRPGVAAARADRPRRRPVVGARLPAPVRAVARARRGPDAAARATPQAWTVSDLPLLDAARQRLGDPEASRRRRRQEAAVAAERERDGPGRRPPDRRPTTPRCR